MDLTIEEFQKLADEKGLQLIKIAELERQLAEKTKDCEYWKGYAKQLEMANTAERLKNMILRNYITLSVEKIKAFVSNLSGLEAFSFLKTSLEYVLPAENYQEQLLLVNEVMTIPPKSKLPIGDIHNHYVSMTGDSACYTENNNTHNSTNQSE